jgi:2-haloacid dehalogenase
MRPAAYIFDAYGTLFDVHAAIARHRAACGPDADRLSDLWRTKQLEYSWTLTLAGHYEDFWTLTTRALDYALARFPSVPAALRLPLLDSYFALDAFADSAPCLAALKQRGLRNAILSNGSPKMLSAAVSGASLGPLLDAVLSVDAVRLYKPRREVYAMVTRTFNVSASDVVFVSSNRWDVMGAVSFGFAAVWVNRAGNPDEYPGLAPHATIAGLAALPELSL